MYQDKAVGRQRRDIATEIEYEHYGEIKGEKSERGLCR